MKWGLIILAAYWVRVRSVSLELGLGFVVGLGIRVGLELREG